MALAPYVAWIVLAYRYHFLDGVNLAFHEAGHLFFGVFGQTIHFLGGTIGQLLFPIACVFHFLRQDRRFEAAICTIWVAESVMYTARYLGDARAQALPLVGGHIHDWNWLLSRAGLLSQCEVLATMLHVLASALALGALAWAWQAAARSGEAAPRERAAAPGPWRDGIHPG
jgi:hypothetical protein